MLVFIEKAMSILLKDGRPAMWAWCGCVGSRSDSFQPPRNAGFWVRRVFHLCIAYCPGCQCCDEILPRGKISLLGEAR